MSVLRSRSGRGARRRVRFLLDTSGLMMAVAVCTTAMAAYGTCPPDSIQVTAPCGIQSVTTTCTGATSQCSARTCSIGPIASDCTVTVVLGDGTSHPIDVTVMSNAGNAFCSAQTVSVASPDFTDLSSASCELDAGTGEAGSDVVTDVSSEAHD